MSFLNTIKNIFLSVFGQDDSSKEAKAIADAIIADSDDAFNRIQQIYEDIREVMEWAVSITQTHMGKIPTEDEFLTVLSYVIDKKINLPVGLVPVSRRIIKFSINMVDKQLLDKYLGEDWYSKLLAKVNDSTTEDL
jgi:hypothetical protein